MVTEEPVGYLLKTVSDVEYHVVPAERYNSCEGCDYSSNGFNCTKYCPGASEVLVLPENLDAHIIKLVALKLSK